MDKLHATYGGRAHLLRTTQELETDILLCGNVADTCATSRNIYHNMNQLQRTPGWQRRYKRLWSQLERQRSYLTQKQNALYWP